MKINLLVLLTLCSLVHADVMDRLVVRNSGNITNVSAVNLTLTQAGVAVGTNELAKLGIGGLFPLPAGVTNYWAIGDSWTYGQFVTPQPWTSSGGPYLMFSPLLYCNLLSSNWNLALNNRGVSGSRIARTTNAPNSTLAQLNVVPANWSGLVTVEHGYNDSTSENYGDPQRTHTLFRSAANAVIARLLASDFGNASGLRLDGTTLGGWSAGGTVSTGGSAGLAPFPTGSATTNLFTARTLTGSQTVTFSATNGAVWLENSSLGGTVQLWQGTNWIATANLSTPGELYYLPQVLLGIGRSGTFTLTNVSGTNILIGAGSIAAPSATRNRFIALCSPGRLNGDRWNTVATSIAGAYAAAVNDWQPYRVYFADVGSRIDPTTMVPSDDLNHPDPRGHIEIAKAIENATPRPADSQINSPAPRFLQGGLQIQGAQIYGGQYKGGPSVFLSMAGDNNGYLDAFNWSTLAYLPLNIRTRNVIIPNSGITISGGFSALSDYPIASFTSIGTSGGQGYLDAANYNGSAITYLPLNVRAKSTRVSGGGLTVSNGPTGTNDYPAGAFTQLAVAGSIGYLDSLTFPGNAAATYIPLEIRAKVTQFGTAGSGAVTVHSGFNSTNDYPNDDFLSLGFSGGQAYLDSLTNQAGVFSLLPLNLRGNRVQIGSDGQGGGLVVQGGFATTNQYPAGSFVSLAMSGNEGYLDANTNSGTSVLTVPLNLRSRGVVVSPGSQGMGLAVQGAYSTITDYPTNKFIAFALSGGEAYVDAYDRTGGTNLAGLPINLRGSTVKVENTLDLGNADTTLSRLSAGQLAVEGVAVETVDDVFPNTVRTLTYSTTNVTATYGGRREYRDKLTLTNNCQLTFSGTVAGDRGLIKLVPAGTNVTIFLASPARSTTGQTVTITAAGSTNTALLAWEFLDGEVLVNAGAYFR